MNEGMCFTHTRVRTGTRSALLPISQVLKERQIQYRIVIKKKIKVFLLNNLGIQKRQGTYNFNIPILNFY